MNLSVGKSPPKQLQNGPCCTEIAPASSGDGSGEFAAHGTRGITAITRNRASIDLEVIPSSSANRSIQSLTRFRSLLSGRQNAHPTIPPCIPVHLRPPTAAPV